MTQLPENLVEMINERLAGFNKAIGLTFVRATLDEPAALRDEATELVAELEVTEQHHQAYGLVHGGVLAGMIETVCSTGAALTVFAEGKSAVGLENATSFLRAVRSGRLRCTGRPLVRGRRSHVWEARIHDDDGRLVATGRVRMLVLEPGAQADGEQVALKAGPGGETR
jgi:1,4-dihydroxy-2-naphthoyl-CoA hydrolase